MTKEKEHMTVEELQKMMNREPTPEEKGKINKNLEIFENEFKKIIIKDGFTFLKNLRKEANRQKAMKTADSFDKQVLAIQNVPDVPCQVAERNLADSFEIYEE